MEDLEVSNEDFKIIKNDCEIKINTVGKELQKVTWEMMRFRDNLNKESSQLLNMLQLYNDAPFDIKLNHYGLAVHRFL